MAAATEPAVRWCWSGGSDWLHYSEADSLALEEAFKSKKPSASLLKGKYIVNFSEMMQENCATKKKRKVVRGTWFWVSNRGMLQPYETAIADKAEAAYQEIKGVKDGVRSVDLGGDRRLTIKNNECYQINTSSGGRRDARRGFGEVKKRPREDSPEAEDAGEANKRLTRSATTELQELQQQMKDQSLCKICLDAEIGSVFTPCGHLMACFECGSALKKKPCPICRTKITNVIKSFAA